MTRTSGVGVLALACLLLGCGGSSGGANGAVLIANRQLYVKNGASLGLSTLRYDQAVTIQGDTVPVAILEASGQAASQAEVLFLDGPTDSLLVSSGASPSPGQILVFESASTLVGVTTAVPRTLTGFNSVTGLFVDLQRRLYVSDMVPNTVYIFTGFESLQGDVVGGASPTQLTGVIEPMSLAYDEANDRLFVCSLGLPGVARFDALHGTSTTTPTGSLTDGALDEPTGLAFDPIRNLLYVSNSGSPAAVLVFDPDTGTLIHSFQTNFVLDGTVLSGTVFMALDAERDSLYVTCEDNDAVFIYDNVSSVSAVNVRPSRIVTSPGDLQGPLGIALDTAR